jgi:hypothetical protein
MGWCRITIPSGCAECAAPTPLAHTLARLAHLDLRKLLAFLSCCGQYLGLIRPQEFSLPPTHEFNLAITRCTGDAPTNQEDAPKAPVLSIRRIHLACQRISKGENYGLFYVVVKLGVRLPSWVLAPTITSS